MLIPRGNERVRSLHVSRNKIRGLLCLVLIATVVLSTFSIGFLVKQSKEFQTRKLEQENSLLAAEVDQMRGEMVQLNRSLAELSAKDQKFRVISGLPEIDPEVQRAGVGGPGTERIGDDALYHLNPRVGEKVFAASTDLDALIRQATLLHGSMDEALGALEHNRARLASIPSIAPSDGHLSGLFSSRRDHPVLRITRPHKGIDIAAPVGEPILAPAKGKVVFAGPRSGGYGNMVEIDHGFGYHTRFAHASKLLVRTGQTVKRGEIIAEVGATGLVTGPHLHYEVLMNGRQVDPLNFIITDAIPD